MRTILLSLALSLVLLAPSQARAQYPGYSYGYPGYGYYPGYASYYPGYYPPAYYGYYSQPYLWSGRYYANPYTRGWTYERYYPYTNQYYYRYRVAPNYWW
jgi:hypothetical protein